VPNNSNPIGVFDSGVGGLTVAGALLKRLPQESIVYFGDTARVPYGVKSTATIIEYAEQITAFLLNRRVKMLIVACNSMAAVAIDNIKNLSPYPVLDVIDAGAKLAAQKTLTGRIGIIGTPATINSGAYPQAIHSYKSDCCIHTQACPLFVPLVEEGWLDHIITRLTAQEYLQPLLEKQIDTLVLGCTHYPLLKPLLQEIVGEQVQLIDSADAMAQIAATVLEASGITNTNSTAPQHSFFVTDIPYRLRAVSALALGRVIEDLQLVKLSDIALVNTDDTSRE